MRDNDNLDLLLNSALSTYGDPGPDAGLEQRVLARIAENRIVTPARPATGSSAQISTAPRRRWVPWAIALPLAAGLILLLLSSPKIKRSPSNQTQLAHESAPTQAVPHAGPLPKAQPQTTHITRRRVVNSRSQEPAQAPKPAPLPKLDVFPSPQPLTPQEHALAVFAIHGPEPERKALAEAQQRIDAPLSIAAIHIPPVQSPEQGTN